MYCKDIIMDWLKEHGYDGLVSIDLECGCGFDDFIPCDDIDMDECEPGYYHADVAAYFREKTQEANGAPEITSLEQIRIIRDIEARESKVKCLVCGEEANLIEIYAGSYIDDAYGAPKRFKMYRQVTACCKSEEYDEIKEQAVAE